MPQKFPRYPDSPTPPAYTPNYLPDIEYPGPTPDPTSDCNHDNGNSRIGSPAVILVMAGAFSGVLMCTIVVFTLMQVL